MGLQFTMEEIEDNTLPEDTIFRATLMEIKQHDFEWTDRSKNPPEQRQSSVLQWWFEVQSPDQYKGRRVKGETPTKLGRNNSGQATLFTQWAEALLDRKIPAGMGIDTDDLLGVHADITVRHQPDKKDPAKKWERVDEVIHADVSGDSWNAAPPF